MSEELTKKFGKKSSMHLFMDSWPLPEGEFVRGQTYRADGWEYCDLPRMTPEYFDQFIGIAGKENLVWLTLANYGATKRGQVLISPKGRQNLYEYSMTIKSKEI
jgi:hypothetical protein